MDDRPITPSDGRSSEDDRFLELLAAVLDDADGPPDAIVDQAASLFVLRDLDAELLELLSDTRDAGLVTRAEQLDWRLVVFQGSGCSITLEISVDDGEPVLIGHVEPAGPHEVELLSSADERSPVVHTDDGRFSVPCPSGPFQVLVTLAGGTRVLTPPIDV